MCWGSKAVLFIVLFQSLLFFYCFGYVNAKSECLEQEASLIVYNRMPKCGSSSMVSLLHNISKASNWKIRVYIAPPREYYFNHQIKSLDGTKDLDEEHPSMAGMGSRHEKINERSKKGEGKNINFNIHVMNGNSAGWKKFASVLTSRVSLGRENAFHGTAQTRALDSLHPLVYVNHMVWPNLTSHFHAGLPGNLTIDQVSFIQIIRNPIHRVVSEYYYNLFGKFRSKEKTKLQQELNMKLTGFSRVMNVNEFYHHFAQRTMTSLGCCSNKRCNKMTRFFCGESETCVNVCSTEALQRALHVINNHYFFIGLMEHFNETVQFLEKALPHAFTNAWELFQASDVKNEGHTTSFRKEAESPNAQTIDLIRTLNSQDMVLYDFIKKMFFAKLEKCEIPSNLNSLKG